MGLKTGFLCGGALTAFLGVAVASGTPAAARSCEDLRSLAVPNTTIDAAEAIAVGSYTPAGSAPIKDLPAFCRVHGVISPVPGSQIGFELWLPQQGWNGKIEMFGNGGYSSAIAYASLGSLLKAGYATVGTDTGHSGDDPIFAADRPEAIVDWGWRAVHETIINAKVIVGDFYGLAPRHAYFAGCSTGGHQALMEAQRFPEDFDGIIAGDPGHNRTHLNAGFLWQFIQNHRPRDNASAIIPPSKLGMISKAAINACRRQNGTVNGGLPTDPFLNDPSTCHFDPASIQCTAGDGPECLTAAQVTALKSMYAGAHDPNTGERIYFGWPPGSEDSGRAVPSLPGWSLYWADPKNPEMPARVNFWRLWAFGDPNWDWWSFDFGHDMRAIDETLAPVINAMSPDLEPFRGRGGKLIQYHGLADPVVPPADSVSYYERVLEHRAGRNRAAGAKDRAAAETGAFYRLFLVPGLEHCRGGSGPTSFDMQSALEAWVERGMAPESIVAKKLVNEADPSRGDVFSRPLCPYPQQAFYNGSGDPSSARNFACRFSEAEHPVPMPGPAYRR